MKRLTRSHLREIQEIADQFYDAKAKIITHTIHDPAVPLGYMVTLLTRAKIYDGVHALIRNYKKGRPHQDILQRILKRLILHRKQMRMLQARGFKVDYESNKKYCVGLAALLHTAFG